VPYVGTGGEPTGLSLGRCGRGSLLLDAAARFSQVFNAPGAELGAGLVSWYDAGRATVFAYDIAQGHLWRWTAPGASAAFTEPAEIVHTAGTVVVATASHQSGSGPSLGPPLPDAWTLYEARLP
jgi:hypothetical protein